MRRPEFRRLYITMYASNHRLICKSDCSWYKNLYTELFPTNIELMRYYSFYNMGFFRVVPLKYR